MTDKKPKVTIKRTGASVVPGSKRTQRTTRPIGRIDDVLGEIKEIWRKYPDMRLTQLLWNCRDTNYVELSGTATDFYNMEEEILLHVLRDRYGCIHYKPDWLGVSKYGQTYRCRNCQEITYG